MRRGDVVLVQVPFVGNPGAKVRPALIVQNDALNKVLKETIIAAITSNLGHMHQPQQFFVDVSTPEGIATGLLTNSAIRCDRLQSVPQSDIRKVIGRLSGAQLAEVNKSLKSALAIP